jgi:tetratricopeptide (TPR) repeat protein
MKKIKPVFIYGFGIILAIVVFWFISSQNTSKSTTPASDITNKQMPNDSLHRSLQMPANQPDKANVMSSVMKKIETFREEIKKAPKDTLKIRRFAQFLEAAHQPKEALEYFDRILKVDPKRIDILYSEAYINYTNRNFTEAEKLLNRIISINKNSLQAYYNLGAIAFSSGNKVKAKEIWTKLVKEHPNTKIGELAQKTLSQTQI